VPIDNATLSLFEDGLFQGHMESVGNGEYRSGLVPKTGHRYSLSGLATGFDPIFAEDSVPLPPLLDSLTFHKNATVDEWGTFTNIVRISFRNEAGVEEYFQVGILAPFEGQDSMLTNYGGINPYALNDPILQEEGMLDYFSFSYLVFRDRSIDGRVYSMDIPTYHRDPSSSPRLQLSTLSEGLFNFQKSFIRHLDQQSGFNDRLTILWNEPHQLQGNIEGGLGIFAAYQMVEVHFTPE